MISKDQCPAHTRTPWGTSEHRIDHRWRYVAMGLLCAACLTIIVFAVIALGLHSSGSSDGDVDKAWSDFTNPGVFVAARPPHEATHVEYTGGVFLQHIPSLGSCGELLGDCKASSVKNFCCPFATACHDTEWSPSGIFCCPDGRECDVSKDQPPECIPGTFQCSANDGGGCCPEGTVCSSQGCRRVFFGASGPSHRGDDTADHSHLGPDGSPIPTTQTYGEEHVATAVLPEDMATHTIVKFGEVARVGDRSAASSTISGPCLLGVHVLMVAIILCRQRHT